MEAIDGVPVIDKMIQEWVGGAKRGCDVDMLEKRGYRPIGDDTARVVPVHMDDSLVAAVDQRAEKGGTSRSETIYSVVRVFVT